MGLINNLPEITFAEKDASVIESEIISRAQTLLNTTFAPADPRLLFLKTFAYYIALQRSKIDYTGKQNLLAYAEDTYLDHKGIDLDTTRNDAEAASVTVRFALSAIQSSVVNIAQGKRVTAGDNVFFYVRSGGEIAAGAMLVDLICDCLSAGTIGNDYQAGQLNILVDPIPYIAAVSNIDVSSGGIDEESDDAYRERIQLSPEKFTTAGSDDGYKYWAKTATQNILDVEVYSPSPGEVNVVALMQGGTLPTSTELELINEVLSSSKRRPLTDKVNVMSPQQVNYQIELTYYLSTQDVMNIEALQNNINTAVSQFVTWQKTKLGRNINPSKLINLIMQAGAERVEIIAPTLQVLQRYQTANCTNTTVNYGGLELS